VGRVGELFLKLTGLTGSQDRLMSPSLLLLPLTKNKNPNILSYLDRIHDTDFCNMK
jgi:hypothetical protein